MVLEQVRAQDLVAVSPPIDFGFGNVSRLHRSRFTQTFHMHYAGPKPELNSWKRAKNEI